MDLGAVVHKDSCTFTVWAPRAERLEVRLLTPAERIIPMQRRERGYWQASVEDVRPGTRYLLRLDGDRERPDPASFYQPEGVHGPSEIVDHDTFPWTDHARRPRPLEDWVLYELHVGTFTAEGTFDAIIPRLEELYRLGVTALQIMPVAQFPGARNWGYDGACPYAVQNSYGGSQGLKQLVNACHHQGLEVVLDVVYNHLGPEGNYLRDFGPYFTSRYKTPWGEAVNYDSADSDEVRRYFIENALYWRRHFHVDALRLDAVHAIYDFSSRPFLQELAETMDQETSKTGRPCHLIAESDLNDVRVIRPRNEGGFGFSAQFNEDFHHSLHALLTGERQGYYADFGRIEDLAKAYREGFVYDWRYSVYRRRRHGSSSARRPIRQLPAFIQNHDQVGNRLWGERLIALVGFEKAKLAAAAVLLSPYVPLLFMGEEYAEKAPFLYFADFSDPDIVAAVRKGRKEEFRAFAWDKEPPDPHDAAVFARSRLDWSLRQGGRHRIMVDFYQRLLTLRRQIPSLAAVDRKGFQVRVDENQGYVSIRREKGESRIFCLMNFSDRSVTVDFPDGDLPDKWNRVLNSAAEEWLEPDAPLPGPAEEGEPVRLSPWSCHLYLAE
ncbi:MAG: malto-oligosyltrehalose trehalohydrolase [Syntrophotaleaceae bacterium]